MCTNNLTAVTVVDRKIGKSAIPIFVIFVKCDTIGPTSH